MSAAETATEQAAIERTTIPAEDIAVGTPVLAWSGSREDSPLVTRTRTPAWRLGHGDLVVSVEGYPGGIAFSHIEVLPAQRRAADTGDRETLARADLTERDYRVAATAFRETAGAMLSEQRHIRDEYLPGWNTAVHRILNRARTLNGHADRLRAALAGEPRRDDGQEPAEYGLRLPGGHVVVGPGWSREGDVIAASYPHGRRPGGDLVVRDGSGPWRTVRQLDGPA